MDTHGSDAIVPLTFEVAKDAVDFLLTQEPKFDSVVWDFIGGEPTLEMELIDKITDYIKIRLYETNHIWLYKCVFHIGTNGMSYRTKAVQDYLIKNKGIVNISITIDGTKEKHDLQRVRRDGSGSFDEVLSSVMLWKEQYHNASTKVTFASDDLKYLKDSICYLWSIGLKVIPANIVYEDIWKEGDSELFESQLRELADHIIDNEMYYDYSVRFFDPQAGFQTSKEMKKKNFCGSGKMITIDSKGNIYPCVRFMDFCMDNAKGINSGSIYSGFNTDILGEFDSLTIENVSDEECNNCNIASGCFACAANNYSCLGTIHKRTTYHCEMQKANIKANKYFWRKYSERTGNISEYELNRYKSYAGNGWQLDGLMFLYILVRGNNILSCDDTSTHEEKMDITILKKAMDYAYYNNVVPVLIGTTDYMSDQMNNEVNIKIIDGSEGFKVTSKVETAMGVFKCSSNIVSPQSINLLLVEKESASTFYSYAEKLLEVSHRLNVFVYGSSLWDDNDLGVFNESLEILKQKYANKQINVTSQLDLGVETGGYVVSPYGMI